VASDGPNSAGTIVNDAAVGNLAWSTVSNSGASDNSYAAYTSTSKVSDSQYLKHTNYSFSIPADSTINGIQVAIERKASADGGTNSRDLRVRLVKGGTVQSAEDKAATGTDWPTTDGTASYGGASDLWSNSWTRAEVTASGFGMVLQAKGSVDHIAITVWYTAPVGDGMLQRFSGMKGGIGKNFVTAGMTGGMNG
jgi:hypothetical protein